MPTWQIHNKWAKEASISQETSNFVNLLIDLPQKHQEFLDSCDKEPDARVYSKGKPTRMTVGPWKDTILLEPENMQGISS